MAVGHGSLGEAQHRRGVPVWQEDICIQCGQCSFVCPHGVIQAKYFDGTRLDGAPGGFLSAAINVRGFPDVRFALDFAMEDCTGCGLCVEACPVVPDKALDQHGQDAAAGARAMPTHSSPHCR